MRYLESTLTRLFDSWLVVKRFSLRGFGNNVPPFSWRCTVCIELRNRPIPPHDVTFFGNYPSDGQLWINAIPLQAAS